MVFTSIFLHVLKVVAGLVTHSNLKQRLSCRGRLKPLSASSLFYGPIRAGGLKLERNCPGTHVYLRVYSTRAACVCDFQGPSLPSKPKGLPSLSRRPAFSP